MHRLAKSFDRLKSQIAILKPPSDQSVRALANHDGVRVRQLLQARGQICCLTDHRVLLCDALPNQIAHNHNAGRNANARLQGFIEAQLQPPNRANDFKTGPDRAFGIVFVGHGIAEVCQDTVAHIGGHHTVELVDFGCGTRQERANNIAVSLWVQLGRKLAGAHHIAEHDRDVPAFRMACISGRRGSKRGRGDGLRCWLLASGRPIQLGPTFRTELGPGRVCVAATCAGARQLGATLSAKLGAVGHFKLTARALHMTCPNPRRRFPATVEKFTLEFELSQ